MSCICINCFQILISSFPLLCGLNMLFNLPLYCEPVVYTCCPALPLSTALRSRIPLK